MPKKTDGKEYIVPGDTIECDNVEYDVDDDGELINPHLGDASVVKYYDKEEDEWYECYYDMTGTNKTNPNRGRLYILR